MNLLITSELKQANRLIDDFYIRIKGFIETEISVEIFWTSQNSDFDLIHIQWPEQLFAWRDIDENDVLRLESRLLYWKERGSNIIVTRHNAVPHEQNNLYKKVYSLIYAHSSAIIHMSQSSINEFNISGSSDVNTTLKNVVIYHPLYNDVKNDCRRSEARNHFNIDEKTKVVLIFGAVRSDKERDFALSVFNSLRVKHKLLLAPSWFSYPPSKKKIFKRILFEIKSRMNIFSTNKQLERKFVLDDEIQIYMNAADIVFLPRFEVLNSGALIMAYTFNKIVVGPNVGSIGEILNLSNNPSFKVGDVNDATSKIMALFNRQSEKIENRKFADQNMSWDTVIKQHMKLYEDIAK